MSLVSDVKPLGYPNHQLPADPVAQVPAARGCLDSGEPRGDVSHLALLALR